MNSNPYRFFFPVGWLLGLVGVSLWLVMLSGWMTSYPKEIHADLMMGGFLTLFVGGFLTTALPRFTASFDLEICELVPFVFSVIGILTTSLLESRLPFHLSLLLNFVTLEIFALRRIRHRTAMPPPPFVFVIAGLAGGIVSILLLILHETTGYTEGAAMLAKLFFYQGLQLFLVLGVGIFLIPNLLGHPGCSPPSNLSPPGKRPPFLRQIPAPMWVVIALFFLSFYLETAFSVTAGRAIRASLLALVSFHDWKIYRLPQVRSTLAIGLWISCWLLLGGLWLQTLTPAYDVHVRHLTYVGGFGLMTLMIATRVTLAHGGHDMTLEQRSKLLKLVVGLILLATTTRTIARLMPESGYLHHLAYAASAWIAALLLWGVLCLPRLRTSA